MKYVLSILAALIVGAFAARAWLAPREAADPIQTIITQLKTHAIVEHERQVAIWYRVCPEVIGVDPQIFVAWPAKLSYELPLADVRLDLDGGRITVRTAAIRADEPAVPTDFLDYLSTDSLFTFADEQKLVHDEVRKASAIARYLTTYYLRRDDSLREDFAREIESLVVRLADALGAGIDTVVVEIPEVEEKAPKLPALALCAGSTASVNGLPFARTEDGYMSPIAFAPAGHKPAGIASVYGGGQR